ncbi:MAG TPA: carbonic anhydrase [Phenylobacterium sp.]
MPEGFHLPTPSPSRRYLLAGGAGWLLAGPGAASAATHSAPAISPADALKRLVQGNARFAHGRAIHPDSAVARRKLLVNSQHPFATILACSDSRVPPELIFDQGLGDLFVIRVAGNVVDDPVLASVEYSVIHLGSPLVMVLGHERCGAVTATLEALAGRGSPEDKETKIGALADLIAPAVRAVPPQAPDKLDAAIILNAERSAATILTGSPPLRERAQSGTLRVVSARYDLEDGTISHLRNASV